MAMTSQTEETNAALAWRAVYWGFLALFGVGAFVHLGLALFSPDSYQPFADEALFGWVYDGWQNVFMAAPTLWALVLGAGELLVAVLLVRSRRIGYVAVVVFHLALMLFGWGFWLWSVPALCFAVPAMVHEYRAARQPIR